MIFNDAFFPHLFDKWNKIIGHETILTPEKPSGDRRTAMMGHTDITALTILFSMTGGLQIVDDKSSMSIPSACDLWLAKVTDMTMSTRPLPRFFLELY